MIIKLLYLKILNVCEGCPYLRLNGIEEYWCEKAHKDFEFFSRKAEFNWKQKKKIPKWCPLPEYTMDAPNKTNEAYKKNIRLL